MERGHLPHDLEPLTPDEAKLRKQIDELCSRFDSDYHEQLEAVRLFSEHIRELRDERVRRDGE